MDEHEGKGGSYEMIDGVRVLVARTDHPIAECGLRNAELKTGTAPTPQSAIRNPQSSAPQSSAPQSEIRNPQSNKPAPTIKGE